jgi:hypothetical protein
MNMWEGFLGLFRKRLVILCWRLIWAFPDIYEASSTGDTKGRKSKGERVTLIAILGGGDDSNNTIANK